MAWYRTRNGQCPTLDTEVQLTSDGSRGVVGNFVVPDGAQSVKELTVSLGTAARTATACGGTFQVRLTGPGLVYGDQKFTVMGYSNLDTGNTGDLYLAPQVNLAVKIAVIPGMEIAAFGAQSGVDWGSPEIVLGLSFTSDSVGKYIYETRNGPMNGAVATAADIGTLYNGLTPGNLNLGGYKRISGFIFCSGNNAPVATAAGDGHQLILNGSCLGSASGTALTIGSQCSLSTTTGNDGGYIRPTQLATDIPLQSGVLTITTYHVGTTTTGVPEAAITLELEG